MRPIDLQSRDFRSILLTIVFLGCLLWAVLVCTRISLGIVPVGESASDKAPTSVESSPITVQKADQEHSLSSESKPPIEKGMSDLLEETFSYDPRTLIDPFIPAVSPTQTLVQEVPNPAEDGDLPPEPQRPLTPLQKMSVSEIEKGLKAIVWGDLGRRAVIEDSTGKGYIVGVGSPAAGRGGKITEIFNDRVVIQQMIWNDKLKRMEFQSQMVKLYKEEKK